MLMINYHQTESEDNNINSGALPRLSQFSRASLAEENVVTSESVAILCVPESVAVLLVLHHRRQPLPSQLWHACAGPLISLLQVKSLVYYFSQGHSEQVVASTRRPATSQIPNYPNLPSQLPCQVQNVKLFKLITFVLVVSRRSYGWLLEGILSYFEAVAYLLL
ncbi:hypothetical protein HN51_062306 [Arachis hypogaea]